MMSRTSHTSLIILALSVLIQSSLQAWTDATLKCSASDILASYDYIIIGGGTSGLTVADRLTEDPSKTVLVIEYGPLADENSVLLPLRLITIPAKFLWNITSAPQKELNNRTFKVLGGAVVGSGSAVNAMLLFRGSKSDYGNWEKLGNQGWGWDGMLPYFRKSVTFTPPSRQEQKSYGITYDVEAAYGSRGPINASYPRYQYPTQQIQWKAWDDVQPRIPKPKEAAGGESYGLIWTPTAMDPVNETRSYAKLGHYDRVRQRTNYHLLTEHKVTKINFSFRLHTKGIELVPRYGEERVSQVKAKKEVILAAGALHTPQLLQLSGIGPKDVLETAGIEVLLNAPGVGQNLQDHGFLTLIYNFTTDLWPNPSTLNTNTSFAAAALEEYLTNKTGPYTFASTNSGVYLPMQLFSPNYMSIAKDVKLQEPTAYLPNTIKELTAGFAIQKDVLTEAMLSKECAVLEYPFAGGPRASILLLKPLSRGSINLNTTRPTAEPVVDYRALSNPVDQRIFFDMFRYIRSFHKTPTMAQLSPVETDPGTNITTDEQLMIAMKSWVMAPSNAHAIGTAAMMPRDKGGVVGPDLLVYGTSGLSIGSIMPLIHGTHTHETVYAVAEKAADLIKGRAYASL